MMSTHAILLPVCGQVFLTFLVWIWMYATRLTRIRSSGIDIQGLADPATAERVLASVVNPSDNLENLFELPVLFYAAALVIFAAGLTDPFYVGAAWAFVGLRAVHSLIHCTSNRIIFRFSAYLFASLVLWAMWGRIALQLMELV